MKKFFSAACSIATQTMADINEIRSIFKGKEDLLVRPIFSMITIVGLVWIALIFQVGQTHLQEVGFILRQGENGPVVYFRSIPAEKSQAVFEEGRKRGYRSLSSYPEDANVFCDVVDGKFNGGIYADLTCETDEKGVVGGMSVQTDNRSPESYAGELFVGLGRIMTHQ